MKPTDQNQYNAWIDGLLTPEEQARFEASLAPEALEAAQNEREECHMLGDLLRAHLQPPPMPNADFFTHSILQQIEQEQREAARSPQLSPRDKEEDGASFTWGLFRRFLAASAACGAIALFCLGSLSVPQVSGTSSRGYYAQFVNPQPAKGISAAAFHAMEENVTVLWLDGLDYVPATAMNTPSKGSSR